MLEVKTQVVTAGAEWTFEFERNGELFIIKNFSSAAIRVCLGGTFDTNTAIRINSNCYEELGVDVKFKTYNKLTISPDGDGEVEIQCLK